MAFSKEFSIQTPKGLRSIGQGHPCFIVAELSANHGGKLSKAIEIIEEALQGTFSNLI